MNLLRIELGILVLLTGCTSIVGVPHNSPNREYGVDKTVRSPITTEPSFSSDSAGTVSVAFDTTDSGNSVSDADVEEITSHKSDSSANQTTDSLAQVSQAVSPVEAEKQNDQTKRDLKALQLAFARLLSDMGTMAEQEWMQTLLFGEMNDPAVWEFVISQHISRGEIDAARYWLSRTPATVQSLPSWQRLILALEDNDIETVERLLNEPNNGLTPLARIQVLRQLGRDAEALDLANEALESYPSTDTDLDDLHQQIDELTLKLSDLFTMGGEINSFGTLDIASAIASMNFRSSNLRTEFQVRGNRLDINSDDISVKGFDNELDVSIKAEQVRGLTKLNGKLGGNLRDDRSIVYGLLNWTHQWYQNVQGQIELAFNELSFETPALRVIGTKHRLSFGVSTNLTSWEMANARFTLQRYQTRSDDKLAQGWGIEGAIGRYLLKASPSWLVRMQGSWINNDLVENLPGGLSSDVVSSAVQVNTVVPGHFGTLGIGTTAQYGLPTEEHITRYHGFLDAWVGMVWPSKEIGYNSRLGLGVSFFGHDTLALNAFYSNTQGGDTSEAYKGVGLQYTYRF